MVSQRTRRVRPGRLVRVIVGLTLLGPASGCSAGSAAGPAVAPVATQTPDSLRAVAQALAAHDHSQRVAAYRSVVGRLVGRCGSNSPAGVEHLVTVGYHRLTSHGAEPGRILSLMRSLAARTTPNGPPRQCQQVVSGVLLEVTGSAGSGASYAGFGATVTAFAAAHRADSARPGSYLPRLPDGRDSYVLGSAGRVTSLVRNFARPLDERYALATVRRQLLPQGRLTTAYALRGAHCSETTYLNPVIGKLLGSPTTGVMIELTSGRGATDRFDPRAVNRARLVTGGRIGGEPCA